MRLFHVSEEANIEIFEPRLPKREDLDPNVGLVWAIDEKRLPNFLTPRDCPRVTYHVGPGTNEFDRKKFFTSEMASHAVIIESGWLDRLRETTLYIYEFDTTGFELQDAVAGYYVATAAQCPVATYVVSDLLGELIQRGIEVRIVDNLWKIANQVKESTLNWSLWRMKNAQPPYAHEEEELGSVVFGTWPQEDGGAAELQGDSVAVEPHDSGNKAEPLVWRVLKKQGAKVLLITENIIDSRRFHEKVNIWETSEIREWLASEFHETAFSKEEQERVVENENGDTVFLLSAQEAEFYFKNDDDRKAQGTDYAIKKGVNHYDWADGYSWWWLRTPGYHSCCPAN